MKNYSILIFFLLFICSNICFAQDDVGHSACKNNLREATSSYATGNFDKVVHQIKKCIDRESFSEENNLKDAIVLLSNTYLASDQYDSAKVYVERLIEIQGDFKARNSDLVQFKIMIEDVKKEKAGAHVSSVSKFSESLYEAPASVTLITEEQIKRRGYMDLEELLHDLPGFDISKNVNGFDLKFNANQSLSKNSDQTANVSLSRSF